MVGAYRDVGFVASFFGIRAPIYLYADTIGMLRYKATIAARRVD